MAVTNPAVLVRRARRLLPLAAGLLAACLAGPVAASPRAGEAEDGGAWLARPGRPAAVWVAPDAGPATRAAAEDLARVLGLVAGTGPAPVAAAPRFGRPAGIHVGTTPEALDAFPDLSRGPSPGLGGPRDRDAILTRVAGGRVAIAGLDDEGTAIAVYRFLQRDAGVRWFFPGELGEVLPPGPAWRVDASRRREVPAFLSREFWFGALHHGEAEWLRRNGLRPRVAFSHGVHRFVRDEDFAAHPERFARFPGGPLDPASVRPGGWQPDFAEPEVVATAAAAARAAFAAGALAFPISPADSPAFGAGPDDGSAGWHDGRPDFSPRVFRFANAVAEALGDDLRGRWLGVLAYHWYESPPPFPVHPRVAVGLALDRSPGSPAKATREDALARAWSRSGAGLLLTYDYLHGVGQAGPRQWADTLQERWLALHAAGARGAFVEVSPAWCWSLLQPWLAAQMLLDPTLGGRRASEVEEEAWSTFAGRGGPALAALADRAADLTARRPSGERWLEDFNEPGQLAAWPEQSWRTASALRDEAVAREPGREPAIRGLLDAGLRAGQALGELDLARERLREGLAEGLDRARLAHRLEAFERAETAARAALREGAAEPGHARLQGFGYLFADSPAPAARAHVDRVRFAPVDGFVGLGGTGGEATRVDGAPARPLTGIEGGAGDVPAGWWLSTTPGERLAFDVVPSRGFGGGDAFEIAGAESALLAAWSEAKPGSAHRFSVLVRGPARALAGTVAFVAWYGPDGRPVDGAAVPTARPPRRGLGEAWSRVDVVGVAPAGAVRALVGLRLRNLPGGSPLAVGAAGWEVVP